MNTWFVTGVIGRQLKAVYGRSILSRDLNRKLARSGRIMLIQDNVRVDCSSFIEGNSVKGQLRVVQP